MHELSIAQSIYATALQEMQQRQKTRVLKIALRIGVWSGVMAEAVDFNFTGIIAGTPLQGAQLKIEEMPLQARCKDCGHTFTIDGLAELKCPACSSAQLSLAGGDELEIQYIEME